MSTARQTTNKTDTAHRSQRDDAGEAGNVQEGRLPRAQSGRPHQQGQGVDETGKDSRAPHVQK